MHLKPHLRPRRGDSMLAGVMECSSGATTARCGKRMKPLAIQGHSQLFFLQMPVMLARGIIDIGVDNISNDATMNIDCAAVHID